MVVNVVVALKQAGSKMTRSYQLELICNESFVNDETILITDTYTSAPVQTPLFMFCTISSFVRYLEFLSMLDQK